MHFLFKTNVTHTFKINFFRTNLPLKNAENGGKIRIKATTQLEGHSASNVINKTSQINPKITPIIPGNKSSQKAAFLFPKPKSNPNRAKTV
jgi:hypothetical protein